jgi:hypothetical protein
MKCSQPTYKTGRELNRLARSPKSRLLVTALFILCLHRIFEASLKAVPLVSTLLSWGATLCVGWALIMHGIECAGYVVEGFSEFVVKVMRSFRRIVQYSHRK